MHKISVLLSALLLSASSAMAGTVAYIYSDTNNNTGTNVYSTTGNGKATQRIPVRAGLHTIGVTFLATNDIPGSELNVPFQRTMNTPGSIPGFLFYPHVGQVWIEGPYGAAGAPQTAARKKIFVCRPTAAKDEEACARTIFSSVVKHAYRRPATNADLATLTEFYRSGRRDNGSFDDGIEAGLQRRRG